MNLIHSKDFSVALPALVNGQLPEWISWAPGGARNITVVDPDTAKVVSRHVVVDARTAERLNQFIQAKLAEAARGVEDLPFTDFNHEDAEASGHPVEARWVNDTPEGRVEIKQDWSGAGKAKLFDRAYRRFSPSFFTNAAGEIVQFALNLGGLVNRAAFKTNKPIVAGGPGDTTTIMDPTQLAADLAAAQVKIAELQSQLDQTASKTIVQAKDAEITSLKSQITTLQTAAADQVKVDAKAAIAGAIAAGKLPPKDTDIQAHYESLYVANPAATKAILAKLPVNPAFKTVVIHGAAPGRTTTTTGGVTAESLDGEVRKIMARDGSKFPVAFQTLSREKPELFAVN